MLGKEELGKVKMKWFESIVFLKISTLLSSYVLIKKQKCYSVPCTEK